MALSEQDRKLIERTLGPKILNDGFEQLGARFYSENLSALLDAARAEQKEDGSSAFRHCGACNSPRTGDACQKCGGELREPHPAWEWPKLPDVGPIRVLAREKGYAIGVHGSQERDLDLIAVPWVEDAVSAEELADHIAQGINGSVIAPERKPQGRWSCNIQIDGWFKLIDLSVAPKGVAQTDTPPSPFAGLGEALDRAYIEPLPTPPSPGGEQEAVAWAMLNRDGSVLKVQVEPFHEGFAGMMAADSGCTVQALGPLASPVRGAGEEEDG